MKKTRNEKETYRIIPNIKKIMKYLIIYFSNFLSSYDTLNNYIIAYNSSIF